MPMTMRSAERSAPWDLCEPVPAARRALASLLIRCEFLTCPLGCCCAPCVVARTGGLLVGGLPTSAKKTERALVIAAVHMVQRQLEPGINKVNSPPITPKIGPSDSDNTRATIAVALSAESQMSNAARGATAIGTLAKKPAKYRPASTVLRLKARPTTRWQTIETTMHTAIELRLRIASDVRLPNTSVPVISMLVTGCSALLRVGRDECSLTTRDAEHVKR